MSDVQRSDFPADFLWGASTASHQVDGASGDQWTAWEKANADRLARTAQQRLDWLPGWDEIKTTASDPANYLSDGGVDHYERYQQDFDLVSQLNLNSFRFSVEWARLEPNEGAWDQAVVDHYHDYLRALKQRGIEPVMTLWHWTMPTWFTDKGGFEHRRNVHYFERFAAKVAEEFGADVRYVITLNEPGVYTAFGYLTGEWPPQRKNPYKAIRVYCNLAEAHRRVYRAFKQLHPQAQIGVAAQLENGQPTSPHNPINRLTLWLREYIGNWWFLNRIRGQQDFVGINYYFTGYYDWLGRQRNPAKPLNDLGWYMEPKGILPVLQQAAARYHKPIIITENGVADGHDAFRKWWIMETLEVLREAQKTGVNLHGYLHWSLLDNFEWAYGWWPRFGLIAVDRAHNMQRSVRPSAAWLATWLAGSGQSLQKR